ncbi:MAG: RusA family crossover junction endodeoxyribonuclease [Geitlerinemataceae cyanobacterium]
MTLIFELLLSRRPVSAQGTSKASRRNKRAWQDYIREEARQSWTQAPIADRALRFTVVYLCNGTPGDINNIIKPIQDALNGLVYVDDGLVRDVNGHMRLLSEPIDVASLPEILRNAVLERLECVYIRVEESSELNSEMKR